MRRWSDCLAGLGEQRTARVTAYLRAAAWAIVLAAMASGCTGFQLGGQPTQPPAEHFVNPAPAVTAYAAKPGSVCSNPTTTSPTDWLTVVCPAADALVVAQAGLRTLQRAAENLQAEESIADSAYSIQELNSIDSAIARAPRWPPGDGVIADIHSAVSSYRNAVAYLRYAFVQGGYGDWRNAASRYLASGDGTVARMVKALRTNIAGNTTLYRYNEFVDHAKLSLKQAYAWFDRLRVANNLVNDQEALSLAQQLADWGQLERNWLIQHPTDQCYRQLKDDYLTLVITPADLVGRNYVRWASQWPANDLAMWGDVTSAVSSFNDGYQRFNDELRAPPQTCTKPKPTPSPRGS